MRKNHVFAGVVLIAVAMLAVGCAKPPQPEIDAAKAALAAAEQAEAGKYAPEALDTASQAMNAVNAELQAQEAKFALFRSYTKTKQLLADAQKAADDAKQAAIEGKEKAKNEARAAIDAVKAAVDSTTQFMDNLGKCPRKPKDFKKDMEMLKGNLDGYAAQVNDLEGAFSREDYLGAKAQAESLKGQVDQLMNDLTAAKDKIKCKF
jgi:multidrug efflux pump subunit AcrA (membrane-fusion protein)